MAGGGGATSFSSVPEYIADSHRLLLVGVTDQGHRWDGSPVDSTSANAVIPHSGDEGTGYDLTSVVVAIGGSGVGLVVKVNTISGSTPTSYTIINSGTGYALTDTAIPLFWVSGTKGTGAKIDITALGTGVVDLSNNFADNPSVLRFVLEKGLTDVSGNPYSGGAAYNPDTDISDGANAVAVFSSNASAVEPSTDWDAFISATSTKLKALSTSYYDDAVEAALTKTAQAFSSAGSDSRLGARFVMSEAVASALDALDPTVIDAAVNSYAERARREFRRSANSFMGGMVDINAVNSSAFIIGLALMESSFQEDVRAFQANLELQTHGELVRSFVTVYAQNLSVYMQTYGASPSMHMSVSVEDYRATREATSLLMQAVGNKVSSLKDVAITTLEANRMKIVAKGEQYARDLEIDYHEKLWDFELLTSAGNVLGMAAGSVVPMQGKPSPGTSALGGAMSGASIGAVAGMQAGGITGPQGALIGGVLGGIAGLLSA